MTSAPDPFYAKLAQLLPDVDIVVLPPEAPEAPQPDLDPAEARRHADTAADVARTALISWWPDAAPELGRPEAVHVRWQPGSDARHVHAVATARTRAPDQESRAARLLTADERAHTRDGTNVRAKLAAGLLRFRSRQCLIEVHSPAPVDWWAVSASVLDVRVDGLATALVTAPATEHPWSLD